MELNITLAEALERASTGLRKKMLHSVELLQKAEKIALNYDAENGYYLAFSGGKDSQALFHMTHLAGVKFRGHMNLSSVDPPEVIRFVKRNYPEVELIKPKKSIFQIAIKNQILPTMRVRWCCAEYKETSGAGKVTLIGIRKAESTRRAKRNEVEINNHKFSGNLDGLDEYRQEQKAKRARRKSKEQGVNITNADEEQTLGCIHGKESLLISPIIYWTEKEVWEFLNDVVRVPHCSLYDEGWHRIGCIGCPMSSHKQKMIENARYPHVKRNWIKAIKAIREGGIQKRIYLVEHPQELESSQKRQRIAQDAGGYIKHPDPGHWMGGEIRGAAMPTFRICKQWMQTNCNWETKNTGVGFSQYQGFHPAPLLTA
jgi:phosphoadenosine phosphosulfate reductase